MLIKLRKFSDDLHEIKVTTRNTGTLEKILNELKMRGNPGHTFTIVFDPDDENPTYITWDGDGNDYIDEIKC